MGPAFYGGLIGLGVGLVNYGAISYAAARLSSQRNGEPAGGVAKLLRAVGLFEIVLFAALGFVFGPTILGG